jgi:hypothetical protein
MSHAMNTEMMMTREAGEKVDPRTGEVLPPPPDVTAVADQLVAAAREPGIELTGPNGLLTGLTRQVLQSALEAEMTAQIPARDARPDQLSHPHRTASPAPRSGRRDRGGPERRRG